MISSKLRRRGLILAPSAVLLVVLAVVFMATRGPSGEPTPDRTAQVAIAAVESRDRKVLDGQLGPDVAHRGLVIDDLMSKFGGRLSKTQVVIGDTESSGTKCLTITASLDARPYEGTLWLTRTRGRWFVSSWD